MSAAAEALARGLGACLAAFPGWPILERADSRAWASAGASGERHRLDLRLPGKAADALLDGLETREFELGGYIVADVAAIADERDGDEARLVIEALTIDAN
jgi:hypothetical protein